MTIKKHLTAQLNNFQSAPFLFVGSGLSRRYLLLETWEDLLRRFSQDLPKPFEYYFSRADGHLPTTAALIAQDFHEVWWQSDSYKASRKDFSSKVRHHDSCLKYEISKYISEKKYISGKDAILDEEIDLLGRSVVDGVITTNWDPFLESVFPDFTAYVGQSAIISSHPQGVAEIYKIHGCHSGPNSLVLTKEDYEQFEKKNPYLAAKLLTIFVEHPVLFLGYSLSDSNVLSILSQLSACLAPQHVDLLRDKLILVQWESSRQNESVETTVVQSAGQNIPITVLRVSDFRSVFECLGSIKRKFPARLLRNMKEHVYELVKSNDPKGKMFVVDIEQADRFSEFEVVYGVGISEHIGRKGYSAIQVEDLLKDVMDSGGGFDSTSIVRETLPRLLRGNAKYVPIFKYLEQAGYVSKGIVKEEGLDPRIIAVAKQGIERFNPPAQYRNKKGEARRYKGVLDLTKKIDAEHAIYLIPLLNPQHIDGDELKQFIAKNMALMNSPKTNTKTYFRSLICLYDWVNFGGKLLPRSEQKK